MCSNRRMTPQQPPAKIHLINTADYRENYANSVQVRVSLWDFFLSFGLIQQAAPDSVSSRRFTFAILWAVFAVLLLALHLAYLRLPFHWDEMGQFVPAALDLYRDGALVPHSTLPNVHPPGVMAMLAVVWSVFGYSILSARLAMLAIASLGL